MTTSTKPKSASHTVQFRDTIKEPRPERSKEALETFSTATNEAAHAVQDCCSTALKGMQDYSSKVAEFTQANIKSYVEFVQKLAGVKSPSEFVDVSTSHTRYQLETWPSRESSLPRSPSKSPLMPGPATQDGFCEGANRAALISPILNLCAIGVSPASSSSGVARSRAQLTASALAQSPHPVECAPDSGQLQGRTPNLGVEVRF